MDGVVVRAASADDALDVAALAQLRHRWRAGERGEDGAALDEYMVGIGEWWRANRATHHAFVAWRNGAPVAMAWLALVERVPGPSLAARRSAYVQSVYVTPDERNAGIGAKVVDAALRLARDAGCDYVAVHPSERSFPFYRRLGFVDVDRVLELDLTASRGPNLTA